MAELFCQGPDWKPRKSVKVEGTCGACGKALEGRNLWFCKTPPGEQYGESCRARYARNHFWQEARNAAVRRDSSKCRRCGSPGTRHTLEVNHIEPRNGQGYGIGCHNHLDNLETLCHADHLVVTATQRGFTPGGRQAARRLDREARDQAKLAAWTGGAAPAAK